MSKMFQYQLKLPFMKLEFSIPFPTSDSPTKLRVDLTLGQLINVLRKRSKLSKSEFAKKFGVSKKLVQQIESDRCDPTEPQYDSLTQQIVECFELDPEWVDFIRSTNRKTNSLTRLERK